MAVGEKVVIREQSKPLLPDVWTEIPGLCVVTSVRNDDLETRTQRFSVYLVCNAKFLC